MKIVGKAKRTQVIFFLKKEKKKGNEN